MDHLNLNIWLCSDSTIAKFKAVWLPNAKPNTSDRTPKLPTNRIRQHGRHCDGRRVIDTSVTLPPSTDILSFPASNIVTPGSVYPSHEHPDLLGECMISPSYIMRQIRKDIQMDQNGYEYVHEPGEVGVNVLLSRTTNLQDRLTLLLIHGAVHLLGYDHSTVDEWQAMCAIEQQVIQDSGILSRLIEK